MEYSKIISVSGLPGLYELITTKSDGAIIRSLDDQSTKFASSRIHNFSHLESIEIFTTRENVNLADVFKAMDATDKSLPETREASDIKKYFDQVYPEIDFERVYNSDLKKMIKWFEILKNNQIEIKLSEPEPEPEPEVEVTPVEEEKPFKQKKESPASAKQTAKKSAKPKTEEKEKTEKKSSSAKATKSVKKSAPKKSK